ncbi:hypothetical protein LOTGIDRAFT_166568 [Lottia gigantea]|uniref:PH domain-containing protein n=1 Tax=Lottia gigantea TaxID=225164 RepID=V3ZSU6_LOTGI|nr:hypothetical protein LOTGIDRAFT_166568 [Lottia gigantea]ESO87417.1 hypothetical protein LOTGIDRAFT_166568 [Lottia gigantea]
MYSGQPNYLFLLCLLYLLLNKSTVSKQLFHITSHPLCKASRKISKCGYLFVAPDFDFNSPLDRSRRWQRRFFVLYDDAELTFSVDDNINTVPQEVIDMNKCVDVIDAEKSTSHPNAIGVVTPEKTHFIKGESKEESQCSNFTVENTSYTISSSIDHT